MTTTDSAVQGWTANGFEGVRDAFAANFASGLEVGAAFTAYHRGQKVADLWGGVADQESGRPWAEDTMILVFSTTKGITAMCANQLVQEGRLDVHAPVVQYWPEFGAAGKEHITVEQLLSHQSGLAWVEPAMPLEDALEWENVVRALEHEPPHWEPGTKHGYHATTFGWLVGEVIRRVSGQRIGDYLREHVAGPLDADFYIGLPEALEPRVAALISMFPPGIDLDPDAPSSGEPNPVREMIMQFMGPDTVLGKALASPGGAFRNPDVFNTRAVRAAEIPAANGIGDARSIARLYAACVGEVDGVRLLTPAQLDDAITQRTTGPNTVLLDLDIQFGLGFMVRSSLIALGGPRSFGHFGLGGSMGWADPDAELALGYVMNRLDMGVAGDVRSTNLVNACYAAI
ncbi:MAG TPA: serine hydrolase domain-containing protein [Acidimicrobiia bacterium]|jgi:CubicO group peptidase (beta-lactamase class C family)